MHIFESATNLFPKKYVDKIDLMIMYANEKGGSAKWVGKALIISIVLAFVGSIVTLVVGLKYYLIPIIVVVIILAGQFITYLILYFKVDMRNSKIEEVLPDALQLIASNLQAGMTPFKAIKVAARKEFGPLAEEFKQATENAFGTKSFSEELLKIGDRVDSQALRRATRLIASSLSSGGHLASLLEELSGDIAETRSLKNEMITNTRTYTMFIMFTIIVGTPLLLAISIHFVGMVQNMQGSTTLSTDEFGLGFMAGELTITTEFLTKISLVVLTVTAVLASMFTGTITKGEMTAGLKYAPAVMVASLLLFFASKVLIGKFFSGI